MICIRGILELSLDNSGSIIAARLSLAQAGWRRTQLDMRKIKRIIEVKAPKCTTLARAQARGPSAMCADTTGYSVCNIIRHRFQGKSRGQIGGR